MEDSRIVAKYLDMKSRCEDLSMTLELKSECFYLYGKTGERHGTFYSIVELEYYMYGYDSGLKDKVLHLDD